MSTKKLQIITPIVTSVNGGTGDITMNSIEYTPQTLTDAQKAQARENIGAVDLANGLLPVECVLFSEGNNVTKTIFVKNGVMLPLDYSTATGDIKTAILNFSLLMYWTSIDSSLIENIVKSFATLVENGIFGDDFYGSYTYPSNTLYLYDSQFSSKIEIRLYSYYAASDSRKAFGLSVTYANGNKFTCAYNPVTAEFVNEYINYVSAPIAAEASKSGDTPSIEQVEMSSVPTTDMQIATKKYVDDGIAGKADSSHNHSASDITSGTLPITRGGTDASTAAAARTNLGFSYGTSVPTSAPVTGNGAVFFCQDSGSPLSIANGGTGGATQDAARTNLGLPTQDKRLLTICSGTRLVSDSNITITLDPAEAKKYSAILILLGTPLGGNYGNMYDSFVFPLSPDTWSFRFFKYTLEGQDWQCAKANLSSDWKTFTITAVSGNTNHPCWCYLM